MSSLQVTGYRIQDIGYRIQDTYHQRLQDPKLKDYSHSFKMMIPDSRSVNNAALIIYLEANNKILKDQHIVMSEQVNQLKLQLNACKEQFDNTVQCLRMYNIEIVALPSVDSSFHPIKKT